MSIIDSTKLAMVAMTVRILCNQNSKMGIIWYSSYCELFKLIFEEIENRAGAKTSLVFAETCREVLDLFMCDFSPSVPDALRSDGSIPGGERSETKN